MTDQPAFGDSRGKRFSSIVALAEEHRKNKRKSTREKHQKGKRRQDMDAPGGEKGDKRRPHRRK